jgi:chaperonin GroEL (HSP60 family)
MMLSAFLREEAKALTINQRHPFLAVADALEVIPRTLVQNCGASVIRTITGWITAAHIGLFMLECLTIFSAEGEARA